MGDFAPTAEAFRGVAVFFIALTLGGVAPFVVMDFLGVEVFRDWILGDVAPFVEIDFGVAVFFIMPFAGLFAAPAEDVMSLLSTMLLAIFLVPFNLLILQLRLRVRVTHPRLQLLRIRPPAALPAWRLAPSTATAHRQFGLPVRRGLP